MIQLTTGPVDAKLRRVREAKTMRSRFVKHDEVGWHRGSTRIAPANLSTG